MTVIYVHASSTGFPGWCDLRDSDGQLLARDLNVTQAKARAAAEGSALVPARSFLSGPRVIAPLSPARL